ncbi:GMP synthase [Amnibacterium sp.]|uniref:GMP synthase n=1 Tax=Amnibacterium sp. TaxID=1872496 RepID=UPI00263A2168|nr:GMP synthase [Amnibacterium sp.]MCU1472789.1 glutamine amidotransferase [Amnibacterium sp.]
MPSDARFLLLQARPEAVPRAQEAASFRSATGLGERLDVLRVDVEPLPSDAVDRWAGFLVGGSPFNVSDPESGKSDGQRVAEASLTRLAADTLDAGRPAFFTCYGIGLVTRLLGGTIDRTHPEQPTAQPTRLTPAGAADPVAGALPASFLALTGHKESAPEPPPGAELLATNDVSPVQLYRVGELLASQFHPEPTTEEFIARATAYQTYGYFPPAELDVIAATVRGASVTAPRLLLPRFVARAEALAD